MSMAKQFLMLKLSTRKYADNLFTLKTVNMCTKRLQLKVGLINKALMGVHAHYRNICHLQQYLCTAKQLV